MYDQAKANMLFIRGEREAAAQMYRQGAEDGDARAAFCYGYCLYYGFGVGMDRKEAKSFFSFARDMEGGEAAYNLGMMYLHGDGVPKDYRRAFQYIRMSAEAGCIEGQLYLGMAHTTGCMFEPDVVFISMIPYHRPEYRTGDDRLLTGDLSEQELEADEAARFSVVQADGREAFEWFRAAALHDPAYVDDLVAKGKYLYAKCYLDGMGTDPDIKRASVLMLMAGRAGSADAIAFLEANGVTVSKYLKNGESGGVSG